MIQEAFNWLMGLGLLVVLVFLLRSGMLQVAFNWIKVLFTFSDLVNKVEKHDERIRNLEIENSAIKTSHRMLDRIVEIGIREKR